MKSDNKYPDIRNSRNNDSDFLKAATRLMDAFFASNRPALLTTVGSQNKPHATWMGTFATQSFEKVICLTSPDSRKCHNILENPNVEWMFCNEDSTNFVYMRGEAKILSDLKETKKAIGQISDFSKTFFLTSNPKGMDFIAIETHVSEIEYCVPKDNIFLVLNHL